MTANKNCIIRLSKYKNALSKLKSLGFVKVFSDNLADAVGVASSIVRKDFSIFGISGSKKGGYNVDDLLQKINHILGKNDIQKVIIVGVGNIGSALIKYDGFEKEGLKICAGFDKDSSKINKNLSVPIYHIKHLPEFVKQNKIKIGVIATPFVAANEVFEIMKKAGIKGVLNFAPVNIKMNNDDVIVQNVDLVGELESLVYFVNASKKIANKRGR